MLAVQTTLQRLDIDLIHEKITTCKECSKTFEQEFFFFGQFHCYALEIEIWEGNEIHYERNH